MLPLLMCVFILSWPIAQALAVDPREADLVPIGVVLVKESEGQVLQSNITRRVAG